MPKQEMVLVPRDAAQSIVDWWRHANEAPGGCGPRAALDGMADDVYALHDALRGVPTQLPVGWIDAVELPRDRYRVVERDDGWHIYTYDPETAYHAAQQEEPHA